MKKTLIIALLLASLESLCTASHGSSSKLATYIGKSNFMSIGATTLDATLIINTPGIYVLTENIASAVTSNQVINVNSDNVVLDLNGYTITGQNDSNMNGIEVAAGKRNVEIKNGTVYNVGNSGIKVNGSVQNLKIRDITFNTCNGNSGSQSGGIALIGASGTEVEHCVVDNCVTFSIVPQTSDAYGIYAKSTRYLTIKNCRAEAVRNIGKNQDAIGYYVEASEYPSIINSDAYLTEGGDKGAGVYLLTCTSAHLTDCTMQGSKATDIATERDPGKGYGFYFENANNSLITGCRGTDNAGVNSGHGFYVTGCINNRFLNCAAEGNHQTSSSGAAYSSGFSATSNATYGATMGCVFKNCTAIGNKTFNGSSQGAAGFILEGTTRSCIIENCLALGNDGKDGKGVGIYLNGNNILLNIIKNNQVFSNTATSSSAYGIFENTSGSPLTLFFENICADNADSGGTGGLDLSTGDASALIPIIGTSLSTFESTQENIKGYNFIADAAHT